jgi:hypothetical protein
MGSGGMKKLFKDILSLEGVKGVMLFSLNGELLFKEFSYPLSEEPEARDWWPLLMHSLDGVSEADLVFEKAKFYVRKTDLGYLIVMTGSFVPSAMVRLNCDMVLPALNESTVSKGRKGLFKKRS